ncbi:MAG: HDIG domain-containing metalloprotein [Oscillospiraceae bacterium]
MIKRQKANTFEKCICDLILIPSVRNMVKIPAHRGTNCLDHSIFVSYVSFKICRRLNLDYVAAARGGLLHDIFLYNWREKDSHIGLHGLTHPIVALKNASALLTLTEMEKDIIVKHMWPLTIILPKYKESFIVGCADKLCATIEVLQLYELVIRHSQLKQYNKN